MLRKIGQNCQIAIPKSIVKLLHLQLNDFIDIRVEGHKIVLEPQIVIPKDQAYFYSQDWQEQEEKAKKDIQKGQVTKTKNIDALLEELDA